MYKIILSILFISMYINAQNIWLKESKERLSWKDAKEFCSKQNARLPSKKEFKTLWLKHNKTSEIEGFDLSVSYWTSTELKSNIHAAYPFYFGVGKEDWYYKADHYGVRCIKE